MTDPPIENVYETEMCKLCDELQEAKAEIKRLKRIANYVGGSPSPIPWDQLQQRYIDEIERLSGMLKESQIEVGKLKSDQDIYIAICGKQFTSHKKGIEHEKDCVQCQMAEEAERNKYIPSDMDPSLSPYNLDIDGGQ